MPEEDELTPEEQAAAEAADAYLDAVGGGLDIPGDPLGASELRQDVDREPVAWPNFPSAHTGGTMSQLSDLAAQVGSYADMSEVLAAIAQAAQVLQAKKETLAALLSDTGHDAAVMGAFGAAEAAIDGALGPVNVVGEAISSAAGAIRGGS